LGNFHCRDAEEEDHEEFIHHEVEVYPSQQGRTDEGLILLRIDVGPDKGRENPGKEGDGEFPQQVDVFLHGCSFLSCRL
jgi:hypothetical protein